MKITEKIIQCWTRKEEPGEQEIDKAQELFTGKPLYLGYSYQKPTLEEIMDTLKAAIKRYGLSWCASIIFISYASPSRTRSRK